MVQAYMDKYDGDKLQYRYFTRPFINALTPIYRRVPADEKKR